MKLLELKLREEQDVMTTRSLVLRVLMIVLSLLVLAITTSDVQAQTTAQDRVDALRLQMEELQIKQLELEQRRSMLEEQLKPENIEKSLAGIGSTRPEELRATRRRQLEIQKSSVEKQLSTLAESRVRLEKSLAQAESDAYHLSARGVIVSGAENPSSTESKAPSADKEQKPRKQTRPRRVSN